MVGGIRADWFTAVVRECQVFIGDAAPLADRPLRDVLARFSDRIPAPASPLENFVLRGILVDMTLRWGEAHHRSYHVSTLANACRFRPAELTSHIWHRKGGSALQILSQWASAYAANFKRAHPLSRAEQLRQYLNRHFAQPIRVQHLAKQRDISVRRLQRDFQTLTGQSIQDYVTERRVDAAIHLLGSTTEKVESIARMVGWSSRKNLNRALARAHGMTPQAFRRARSAVQLLHIEPSVERTKASDYADRGRQQKRRMR